MGWRLIPKLSANLLSTNLSPGLNFPKMINSRILSATLEVNNFEFGISILRSNSLIFKPPFIV
jgi:hypothetical protein